MKQALVPVKKNPKRDANFKKNLDRVRDLSERLIMFSKIARNNYRLMSKMEFGKLYIVTARWHWIKSGDEYGTNEEIVTMICSPMESNKGSLYCDVYYTKDTIDGTLLTGMYVSTTHGTGWELLSIKPVPVTDLPRYLNEEGMVKIIEYNMKGTK
jgi:hypothetical protein